MVDQVCCAPLLTAVRRYTLLKALRMTWFPTNLLYYQPAHRGHSFRNSLRGMGLVFPSITVFS
nr:hypothetical protein Q903MT_gene403 [Picea sitchensis]